MYGTFLGKRFQGRVGLGGERFCNYDSLPLVTLGRRDPRVHIHGMDEDARSFINVLYGARIGVAGQSGNLIPKRLASRAVDELVKQLKDAGIWTLCGVIFPFIGGDFNQATNFWGNSLDLKSPSFGGNAIFFSGSVAPINSELGCVGATNCFATSPYVLKTLGGNFAWHVSAYVATASLAVSACCWNIQGATGMTLDCPNGATAIAFTGNGQTATATITDRFGFIIGTRTSTTSLSLYRKGELVATNTTLTGTGLANAGTDCMLKNSGGAGSSPMTRNMSFASLGNSLTDAQAFRFSQIVQEFQQRMGRAV